MTEFDFIGALRAIADAPGARRLQDDAALLDVGGETLVLTHDTIVQGVHIREDEDPADIAWKLVAVNLSDLAAKGAQPLGVLVSHMLGDGDERFVDGLRDVLVAHDVSLLGGDTVRAEGRRSWGCTAIGKATHMPVPDRRGAAPGDGVYVSGTIGRAMLGMEDRGSGSQNDLAYRRPKPLLAEGALLAPVVSAMMDVSDGLLLDCWRLAQASDCTIRLASDSFPVADRTRAHECVRWGDDYQLLFTAPVDASLPVAATRIGSVDESGGGALWMDDDLMTSPQDLGYQH